MRMRKLGHGQSVLFCIPREIQHKILALKGFSPADNNICVADILCWVMTVTCQELRRGVPLWITQGLRFYRHRDLWDKRYTQHCKPTAWTPRLLEAESQSIEARYSPANDKLDLDGIAEDEPAVEIVFETFKQRCSDFGIQEMRSSSLEEEQERELAPEAERERQIERPPKAEPHSHVIHADVIRLVKTGKFSAMSQAFIPAFQALNDSTGQTMSSLELNKSFPHLYVTKDFASTIKTTFKKNIQASFQRSVQWVMTVGRSRLVIISPFEAQHLLDSIASSSHVALHLYAPRTSFEFAAQDLQLYTVTAQEHVDSVSRDVLMELNLFAGQLYMSSFDEYTLVCDMLGLAWTPVSEKVEADGFIPPGLETLVNKSSFTQSPVAFVKALLSKIRQDCESIDKTHMGKVLAGILLEHEDFSS